MSMSTHVVAFRPADARWKQMKAIYEACEVASVKIPAEVLAFFNGEPPRDKPGLEFSLVGFQCLSPWKDEMQQGFELDVTRIPPEIRIIRFYNSW